MSKCRFKIILKDLDSKTTSILAKTQDRGLSLALNANEKAELAFTKLNTLFPRASAIQASDLCPTDHAKALAGSAPVSSSQTCAREHANHSAVWTLMKQSSSWFPCPVWFLAHSKPDSAIGI